MPNRTVLLIRISSPLPHQPRMNLCMAIVAKAEHIFFVIVSAKLYLNDMVQKFCGTTANTTVPPSKPFLLFMKKCTVGAFLLRMCFIPFVGHLLQEKNPYLAIASNIEFPPKNCQIGIHSLTVRLGTILTKPPLASIRVKSHVSPLTIASGTSLAIFVLLLPLMGCYNLLVVNVGVGNKTAAALAIPLDPAVYCAALTAPGFDWTGVSADLKIQATKICTNLKTKEPKR